MNPYQKQEVESFALEMLGLNASVAIQTSTLKSLGVDVERLCAMIGDYNTQFEEERKYTFEKEGIACGDPSSFAILIKKK